MTRRSWFEARITRETTQKKRSREIVAGNPATISLGSVFSAVSCVIRVPNQDRLDNGPPTKGARRMRQPLPGPLRELPRLPPGRRLPLVGRSPGRPDEYGESLRAGRELPVEADRD